MRHLVMFSMLAGCSTPPAADALALGDPVRGEYIATIAACKECHTLRDANGNLDRAQLFGGGVPFVGPWGVVASANVSTIAASMPAGIVDATIRGRMAFKFQMPTELYAELADDDMADLIAYLRTLAPIERVNDANTYDPAWRPPPPLAPVPHPERAPRGPTVERGRYLATIAICRDCHSPRSATSPSGYDEAHVLAGGGISIRTHDGQVIVPPNLTPDRETGLGAWTDEEIIRAMRTGVARDGRTLSAVMPSAVALHVLTDEDARAIVAYLRSLPAVRRLLPANPPVAPGAAPEACCYPGPTGGYDGRVAELP